MNNGMCGKCYATLYYDDCEDFDQDYCSKYLIDEVKLVCLTL